MVGRVGANCDYCCASDALFEMAAVGVGFHYLLSLRVDDW